MYFDDVDSSCFARTLIPATNVAKGMLRIMISLFNKTIDAPKKIFKNRIKERARIPKIEMCFNFMS